VATALGEFGAEVIKVEQPGVGDQLRTRGARRGDVGLVWKSVSRNKKCVTLDLRTDGRSLLHSLLDASDVFVIDTRTSTLARRYWIISVSIGRCMSPARRSALQLAPFRRTQAAHDECHTAISFESMLVAGNTEVTDLLGVTVLNPPRRTLDDTARRASLRAGAGLGPHRHSGPVFGYVLMA
jgi:hypothetical protein